MIQELKFEDLQSASERTGLKLSAGELRALLPGVNRARNQATELREILDAGDEPASTFDAVGKVRK